MKYVRNNCFRPTPNVASFDELNDMIMKELTHDMDVRTLPDGRTVREALESEQKHLRPLPAHAPLTCRQMSRVADKFGHVRVARVAYSVPIEHAYQPVWVQAFHDRLQICVKDQVVACHERVFDEGALQLDPRHILPLLGKKHRAVAESTAIANWDIPEVYVRLREELRKDTRKPDQEWVQVLMLADAHGEEALEAAVAEALERGSARLETIRQILRVKERGLTIRPTQALPSDAALMEITIEVTSLSPYDDLGEASEQVNDRRAAASSGRPTDAVSVHSS